jgi:hypothetical protein
VVRVAEVFLQKAQTVQILYFHQLLLRAVAAAVETEAEMVLEKMVGLAVVVDGMLT